MSNHMPYSRLQWKKAWKCFCMLVEWIHAEISQGAGAESRDSTLGTRFWCPGSPWRSDTEIPSWQEGTRMVPSAARRGHPRVKGDDPPCRFLGQRPKPPEGLQRASSYAIRDIRISEACLSLPTPQEAMKDYSHLKLDYLKALWIKAGTCNHLRSKHQFRIHDSTYIFSFTASTIVCTIYTRHTYNMAVISLCKFCKHAYMSE